MKKRRFVDRASCAIVFGALLISAGLALPARGQVLEWVRQAGGVEFDQGAGIALDGEGNLYVTGSFSLGTTAATLAVFGLEDGNQTELNGNGGFVAKYDNAGNLLWVMQGGGEDVATDEAGFVYTVGGEGLARRDGDGDLIWTVPASGESIALDGKGDIYVIGGGELSKYDGDGNPIRVIQAAGTRIAVDGEGNVYATGNDTVAKYDGEGTLLWTVQDTLSNGLAIASDAEGNIYITGVFFGPAGTDVFVAKYDTDGNLLWERQEETASDEDYGRAIAIDRAGNSYVTGVFDFEATFGSGEPNETFFPAVQGAVLFVAKYTPDGRLAWADRAAVGTGFDDILAYAIAVDEDGSHYLTGFFLEEAIFGDDSSPTNLTDLGNGDIFVTKFGVAGGALRELIDTVEGFDLDEGIGNSLTAKLRNVLKATESPNADRRRNAAHLLEAFIHQVEALEGKKLSVAQADQLIGAAEEILDGL